MREILEMTKCMLSVRKILVVLMFRHLKRFLVTYTSKIKRKLWKSLLSSKTTCYIPKVTGTLKSLKEMKDNNLKIGDFTIHLFIHSINTANSK